MENKRGVRVGIRGTNTDDIDTNKKKQRKVIRYSVNRQLIPHKCKLTHQSKYDIYTQAVIG